MSNELLPYLDFEVIRNSGKKFYGYSDLTTILNAIYTKTGKEAVLYQIRNLLYRHSEVQRRDFINTLQKNGNDLYDLDYHFIQGTAMEGVMIGGNIRCFLKLAGTEYMPDLHNKILLLEALNTSVPQLITFLSQLKQLHAFDQVNGILLGTFTRMEKEQVQPDAVTLVKEFTGPELPIAKTAYIGTARIPKVPSLADITAFKILLTPKPIITTITRILQRILHYENYHVRNRQCPGNRVLQHLFCIRR